MTTRALNTQPYTVAPAVGASDWYLDTHLFTWLATAEQTGGQLSVLDAVIQRGGEPPAHTHSQEDEAYLVLDGTMRFNVEGIDDIEAEPGRFVWLPRGRQHSFTLLTPSARALILITPGGLEQAFRPFSRPAPALELPTPPPGPPPIAEMLAAFAGHGVEFAPPPAG